MKKKQFIETKKDTFTNNFMEVNFKRGRAPRDKEMYKKHLKKIPINNFIEIYAERYFIQVTLRCYRTPMQDFDGFYEDFDGNYHVFEIKQKDANITASGLAEFGWDTHRLSLYRYIMEKGDLKGDYIISEINNRDERKHTGWLTIDLDYMCRCMSWGADRGGTLMLPKAVFTKIDSK